MQDFSLYFELGWQHILDWKGYDHILFIIALCAAYNPIYWRKILILITAFTIGHTITLILSTFEKIAISSNLVEFLIPATITFTALINLLNSKSKNSNPALNYTLALIFGLIHGMGFSTYLKSLLGKSANITIELFAFNIGLEFGQLIIVASILVISFFVHIFGKSSDKNWRFFLSSATFGIAFMMILERLKPVINFIYK